MFTSCTNTCAARECAKYRSASVGDCKNSHTHVGAVPNNSVKYVQISARSRYLWRSNDKADIKFVWNRNAHIRICRSGDAEGIDVDASPLSVYMSSDAAAAATASDEGAFPGSVPSLSLSADDVDDVFGVCVRLRLGDGPLRVRVVVGVSKRGSASKVVSSWVRRGRGDGGSGGDDDGDDCDNGNASTLMEP